MVDRRDHDSGSRRNGRRKANQNVAGLRVFRDVAVFGVDGVSTAVQNVFCIATVLVHPFTDLNLAHVCRIWICVAGR